MKITILGAAGGEVTGSAYWVETSRARVLVDFGMFQGGKAAEAKNHRGAEGVPKPDAVVVTHAHLDHTGRLPLLAKHGYRGPVFASEATLEMMDLILRDSAKIQAQDAVRTNRKLERAGEPLSEPLYTPQHVETIRSLSQPVPFHQPVTVAEGISIRLVEAGHMLGSSSIELTAEDNGERRVVVFSGDLGPRGVPILRDYETLTQADLVIMESTYGDHDHRPFAETVDEFLAILKSAIASKGKVLVPTFAVGRAQLLLTLLAWAFRRGHLSPFPIFLDSPMAIEATKIYSHHEELFDEQMVEFLKERPMIEDLRSLTLSATADESRKINDVPGPCLVLAGAGMCNAGRIQHHLKQNLWRPETHVLIVGYQASGTLGRMLVEGEKRVSIHGEKIAVRAQVHTLGGFSAHAGQTDLLKWFGALAPSQPRVVLTHGELEPRATLAGLVRERFGITPVLPAENEVVQL